MRRTLRLKGDTGKGAMEFGEGETADVTFVLEENGRRKVLTGGTTVVYLARTDNWFGDNWDIGEYSDTDPSIELKVTAGSATPAADQTVEANRGETVWAPAASDLDTPGRYYLQVKFTDSGGDVHWFPTRYYDGRAVVYPALLEA